MHRKRLQISYLVSGVRTPEVLTTTIGTVLLSLEISSEGLDLKALLAALLSRSCQALMMVSLRTDVETFAPKPTLVASKFSGILE